MQQYIKVRFAHVWWLTLFALLALRKVASVEQYVIFFTIIVPKVVESLKFIVERHGLLKTPCQSGYDTVGTCADL